MMKKILSACMVLSALFAVASCNNGNTKGKTEETSPDTLSLIGKWTTTGPIDSTELGIELKADGTAASINMPTLPYDKWKKTNDSTITIHGRSIFDGETAELTDTFDVDKADNALKQRNTDIIYRKSSVR